VEGICLDLIKEFDKVLKGQPYSVLPLRRLYESDPTIASAIEASRVKKLAACTSLVNNMLKRKADEVTGEVITRPALGTATTDNEGNIALSRPQSKHREALGQVTQGVKRKATFDPEREKKSLNKLTKTVLMEIADAENALLPEKDTLRKIDYVEAICKVRTPLIPTVVSTSVENEEEKDDETTTIADVGDDEGTTTVSVGDDEGTTTVSDGIDTVNTQPNSEELLKRKFIAVNTIAEMKVIIANEKIVIAPGKKNHKHYVDAIYKARYPSPDI
jgi:hypothetical protein